MKISEIKQVVNNSSIPDDIKKILIINILAQDENVISDILQILESERETKNALISESNSELSRALVTLQDPNIGKKKPKPIIDIKFVITEIKKHYLKWQNHIRCNFKIKGLP